MITLCTLLLQKGEYMNKVIIEISNCCDCPHSYTEKIYTPDPFEHEDGLFCSQKDDKGSYNKKHKLIVADEWDLRRYANIPDWCPLLKQKENIGE